MRTERGLGVLNRVFWILKKTWRIKYGWCEGVIETEVESQKPNFNFGERVRVTFRIIKIH